MLPGIHGGPDVPGSYNALLFLIIFSVFFINKIFERIFVAEFSPKTLGVFLQIFLLTCVNTLIFMVRLPYGYAVMAGNIIVMFYWFYKVLLNGKYSRVYFNKKWGVLIPLFILLFLIPIQSTSLVLNLRNHLFGITSLKDAKVDHGISHNLYLGLGYGDNPWRIQNGDMYGLDVASRIKPGVNFASQEYFNILGAEYLKNLKRYPLKVIKIYWFKFKMLLKLNYRGFNLLHVMLLSLSLCLCCLLGAHFLRKKINIVLPLSLLGVIVLLTLQGVLVDPSMGNIFPVFFAYTFLGIYFVEYTCKNFFRRSKASHIQI